jgi:transposase
VEDEAMAKTAGEAAETSTTDHTSTHDGRIEVITGRERRRAWTVEQKLEIVAESLVAGASPIAVARRHGVGSGLLYTWRQQMVRGELGAVAKQSAPGFARVDVVPIPARLETSAAAMPEPGSEAALREQAGTAVAPKQPDERIEIVLPGGVVLRVGAAVDEGALGRVLAALAGR